MLSELKSVLTDMIRIHFIALGILGERAWKNILNSHCVSGAINESGKKLDTNASCTHGSPQLITVSMA